MSWLLLGVAGGGVAIGLAAATWWWSRQAPPERGEALAVDFQHVLDLVRRVHGAAAACVVAEEESATIAAADVEPTSAVVERAVATARLAMADGREHVVPVTPCIVAVGDHRVGAALVLPGPAPSPDALARIGADLRRLVAGFRVRVGGADRLRADPHQALASALTRLESVEALSLALCEAARDLADRPTALVLREESGAGARIAAVSRTGDTRLAGARVSAESAAGRAMISAVPVVGLSLEELFGAMPGDRRRRQSPGIAFPLHNGQRGSGALVVFGPPASLSADVRDRLAALAAEMTLPIGIAAAVRAAEARALVDDLTGLPNRRALERAMARGSERAALLLLDADHFKRLNDSLGHPAGDAALRHLAQVLQGSLRDGDLAARIGGEEFALWLDGAGGAVALEVAERVRRAAETTVFRWAGAEVRLTLSIGVACHPEPIADLATLQAAADAALYRAKEGGRNRVEVAGRAG